MGTGERWLCTFRESSRPNGQQRTHPAGCPPGGASSSINATTSGPRLAAATTLPQTRIAGEKAALAADTAVVSRGTWTRQRQLAAGAAGATGAKTHGFHWTTPGTSAASDVSGCMSARRPRSSKGAGGSANGSSSSMASNRKRRQQQRPPRLSSPDSFGGGDHP